MSKKEIHEKNCVDCGDTIEVEVSEDGGYVGGHYFGEMEFPTGEGEHRELDHGIGIKADGSMECEVKKENADNYEDFWSVTEWTGEYESVEYWECEECFSG